MKAILFALSAILAVVTARGIGDTTPHLLGTRQCTWGPGFWCQNLTNAAVCNSTKHCIKNVWTGMTVPEDRDSVCDICKEMVKEARDQLQSNQTQEDLKAVFEGSCKLMVIEPVVRECDRLVDQFIPELVETLASQMDPSVVCSVSGLCNSEKIDRYIKEYEELMKKTRKMSVVSLKNDQLEPDSCSGCYTIATHMTEKFQQQSKDHLAGEWLSVCGRLGSFSDACSSLVLVNFNTIYNHLRDNLNAKNVCHLTGQCAGLFHKHEDEDENIPQVEIRPLSSVGMVEVGDDLPCKLCEQLVGHLRDLLVANTTEAEFQKVLEGFCKETKSFSSECLSIVDQYYPEIYGFLTHGLNGNAVCEMAGICPLPGHVSTTGPLMPLLPEKSSEIGVRLFNQKKQMNVGENGAGTRKDWPKTEADEMQLPIERIETSFSFSMPNMDVKGQKTCKLCEYVLHYLQQVITNPATEDEVKKELDKICTKIPKTFEDTCEGFVQTYGDTVVAILAQEVDPSVVCPMIYVCPSKQALDAWEKLPKDLMLRKNVEDKPSCPLCLLAITQLENAIKNDRTEANIEYQLDRLCMHLPKDLTEKCTDLVKGYSKEIVQKLIDDIQPQEVCVYIQLCDPNASVSPAMTIFPMDKDGEIMTNEIPDVPADVPTFAVVKKKVEADEKCVLCELFMQYAEKALRNKSTKDEIKIIIHDVCKYMPHKYSEECNNFVDEYANLVIDLLSQEVSPQEVCALVGLCKEGLKRVLDSVAECAVCQALVSSIDTMLVDPKVDTEIETIVSKACNYIPASKQGKCTMMLEVYEQSIINLLKRGVNTKKICTEIVLCSSGDLFAMSNKLFRDRRHDVYGTKRCTWGEAYWCASPTNAIECKAEKHCEQKLKGMSTSSPTQLLDESSVSRT